MPDYPGLDPNTPNTQHPPPSRPPPTADPRSNTSPTSGAPCAGRCPVWVARFRGESAVRPCRVEGNYSAHFPAASKPAPQTCVVFSPVAFCPAPASHCIRGSGDVVQVLALPGCHADGPGSLDLSGCHSAVPRSCPAWLGGCHADRAGWGRPGGWPRHRAGPGPLARLICALTMRTVVWAFWGIDALDSVKTAYIPRYYVVRKRALVCAQ